MTVADLSAKLGLDSTGFDQGMNGVLGKMNPMKMAFASLGVAGAAAIAGIGLALLKIGPEFDDAFDNMRIGTGKTGAALEGLQDDFKAVFATTPVGMQEVSVAITEVNRRLSITGPELQKVTREFLELSRVTKTDVAENIRLGTRLFGDWSISTANQGKTLDLLFRATQQSGIGLTDLMTTVVQFGAPLRNMGFGFAESVAMLSKWEKEGVNTSTVLTGMKYALKMFAKAGKEPQAALEGTIKKIREMNDAQAAMALGMKTFGLRAGPDMVAAIREGRFEYDRFLKTLKEGKDTVEKATEATDDWRESLKLLKNRGFLAAEPAASAFFDAVGKGAKQLTKLVDSPAFGVAVKSMTAAFWAAVPVTGGAWSAIKVIIKSAQAAIHVMVSSGGGRVVAAVRSAMGAARGAISSAWSAARSATSSAWSSIAGAVQSGASRVVGIVGGLPGRMRGALGSLGSVLYSAGVAMISGLSSGITSALGGLLSKVSSMAGQIASAVRNALSIHSPSAVFHDIGVNIMAGLADGIETRRGPVTSTMRNIASDLASGVSGARFPALAGAGGYGAAAPAIHEHYYVQLPGGSAIVGNAEDVGRQIAPAVGRRHEEAAAARARSR